MGFYIIYVLFSPIVWLIILFLSCFSSKIRSNYFSFYQYLESTKRYISINKHNKEVLLFHAASVGEYEQLQPILRLINRNKYFVVQSFTSPSIFNQEKDTTLYDVACYHPFDLPWLSIQFFLSLKPSKYIITRHDIWPGHIVIAKIFKISLYYINGI
jgi:3-deoxy-D-manno-octulosonic-acid transferase